MKRILSQGVIRARDQNKVFVEKANRRRLSPADAVDKYDLDPGRGNAHIEFDMEDELLQSQTNDRYGFLEWFIVGDVSLENRDPEGIMNI